MYYLYALDVMGLVTYGVPINVERRPVKNIIEIAIRPGVPGRYIYRHVEWPRAAILRAVWSEKRSELDFSGQ